MTNLKLANSAAEALDGTVVCFSLRAPCSSLVDFCADGDQGRCRVAFFSETGKCCPVVPMPSSWE